MIAFLQSKSGRWAIVGATVVAVVALCCLGTIALAIIDPGQG